MQKPAAISHILASNTKGDSDFWKVAVGIDSCILNARHYRTMIATYDAISSALQPTQGKPKSLHNSVY